MKLRLTSSDVTPRWLLLVTSVMSRDAHFVASDSSKYLAFTVVTVCL